MDLFFSILEFGTPAFDESISLRDDILRKPLNLSFTCTQISAEYDSIHLGAYNSEGQLLACLVLQSQEEGYKMRQVAVKESFQGKGIGGALVDYSESIVKALGGKNIYLHARDTAIPFYLSKSYKKKGKSFEEVGIKHYKMSKKLSKA